MVGEGLVSLRVEVRGPALEQAFRERQNDLAAVVAVYGDGSSVTGRTLDLGAARLIDLLEAPPGLSSGRYDALSGRQLSVHDDLDRVLERIDDVRHREIYVLGLQRLSA
jgi:hypothetical protein